MGEMIDYINNLKYRATIIKSLSIYAKFPLLISKDTNIPQNQVSAVLKQLMDKRLVELINPEDRKGRLYKITNYGEEVLSKLSN